MISIEIPDDVAAQLRLPPKRLELQLKQEPAIHLLREGICTPAQGARLAQMPRLPLSTCLARGGSLYKPYH